MNYHSHKNRDEIWMVISGTGRTVLDGMVQEVHTGDVITMQAGCRHTIIAETELKVIEVQLGKEISIHDKRKFQLEELGQSSLSAESGGKRLSMGRAQIKGGLLQGHRYGAAGGDLGVFHSSRRA